MNAVQASSLTNLPHKLPEVLRSFKAVSSVGYGAYAHVIQVKHAISGNVYALKIVEKEPLEQRGMLPQLVLEFGLQRCIQHPHIVAALQLVEDATHAFMMLDLCVGGSLWQASHRFPGQIVPETTAAAWLRGATEGLIFIHDMGLVHRDVKLENLLLDGQGLVRLCDLGWCTFESDKPRDICGTPQLAPPEVRYAQTSKMDTWALGACLLQLLTGKPLRGPNDAVLRTPCSMCAQDLSVGLFRHEPTQRFSAREAQQQPFLWEARQGAAPELHGIQRSTTAHAVFVDLIESSHLLRGSLLEGSCEAARRLQQAYEGRNKTPAVMASEYVSVNGFSALPRADRFASSATWRSSVALVVQCRSKVRQQRAQVDAAAREAIGLAAEVLAEVEACRRAISDIERRRRLAE